MQGHFIHPAPPSPTEKDSSRPRDSELIMVAKVLKNPSRPTIVAGDLNDVAWSRSTRLFMQISGFLDPRKGRGFYNTFHAGYFFMRWPLDHLFHSICLPNLFMKMLISNHSKQSPASLNSKTYKSLL